MKDRQKIRIHHDTLLPISIVSGIVGMLVGTLPASIWIMIFRTSFSPLYILVPLSIYFGLRLLKGYTGYRGVIITVIFSLFGLYLTVLSSLAAIDVIEFKMFILSLPLATATLIGKSGVLPSPVISSANIFPVMFTAFGTLWTCVLLLARGEHEALAEPSEEHMTSESVS